MDLNITAIDDPSISNSTGSVNSTSPSPIERGPLTGIFDGINFGLNNSSFHQLLTALAFFLIISAVIVVAIIIFRCYMIYCRSYANTTVYQLPMHRRNRQNRRNRRHRRAFFWHRNSAERDPNNREEPYTFQSIFDDPSNDRHAL